MADSKLSVPKQHKVETTFRMLVEKSEVDAFVEALEFMTGGHYDAAMMMPVGDDFMQIEQAFLQLQTRGRYPVLLELPGSWSNDYLMLLWWATREELADCDSDLQALDRLERNALDVVRFVR